MSFSKDKRNTIKKYILEKISRNALDDIDGIAETFSTTRQTVYRYIREMKSVGLVYESEDGYHIKSERHSFKFFTKDIENEDRIYVEYVSPLIQDLPANVYRIWQYSFSEMLNNAIEHSSSAEVEFSVYRDAINTGIVIYDNGVGIFQHIADYFNYNNLDDAITELFKGKLTTDKEHHSGEGIFFSSRAMDEFAAISSGKIFSHNEFKDIIASTKELNVNIDEKCGTYIYMRLYNHSNKVLADIMNEYADVDGGFTKTRIPIKNIFPDFPVSRSQAKRLTNRFDSFHEVELDFEGIDEIGQGFAHEIFSVYTRTHPEVQIIPFNTSLQVQRMIYHVTH